MVFTYEHYQELIKMIEEAGFQLCYYDEYKRTELPCLLRHDIDYSIDKALEFADFEKSVGIKSTYFVMLTSKMYNAFSKENMNKLKKIYEMDHKIGLHFDETRYGNHNTKAEIIHEKELLEYYLGYSIDAVSMHEPSKEFIESEMKIPNMINTYADVFFHQMEYCSDSMMKWKKSMKEVLENGKRKRGLQILTHPVWWSTETRTRAEALADIMDRNNWEKCSYIAGVYPEHKDYVYSYVR